MSVELKREVKAKLALRGLNQGDLARMFGITDAYLSQILNGKNAGPKAQLLIKQVKSFLKIEEAVKEESK